MVQMQRDVLRDALAFYEELIEAQRDDPALVQETALVTGWLGTAHIRLGQKREAEALLRQAIGVLEPPAAAGRLGRAELYDLARLYSHLGWLFGQDRRAAESRQAHAHAVAHAEQLAKEEPTNRRYQDHLATCCIDLGNCNRTEQPREAERLYRRALALLTGQQGNRSHWGRAHLALGEFYLMQRRFEEAAAALQEAEATYLSLSRQAPRFWQNLERLADVYTVRGRLLAASGRPVPAVAAYRQAVDLLRKLQRDYPSSAYYRIVLARIDRDLPAVPARGDSAPEEFRRLRQDVEEMLRSGTDGDSQPK
jgi:tetratricopeptide (TPR) repeat protein